MDIDIAQMSVGERAMLINILDRGLASLTLTQRTNHARQSVATLQRILKETPRLDAHAASTLAMLAFRPRGLKLNGVANSVLQHLNNTGRIVRDDTAGVWRITWQGWTEVWETGQAAHLLDTHHDLKLTAAQA